MQSFNAATLPSRAPTRPGTPVNQRYPWDASVTIIGQRGVGKSTIAFIASHALWRDVLETETLLSRGSDDPDRKYGHDIPSILSDNRRGKIVIISADRLKDSESRRAVEQFAQFAGPVIHISRSRALSFKYLRAGNWMTDSELQALDEDWSSTEASLMEMCTASFVNLNCLSAEDIYPPAYRPWEDMCPKSNIARPNGAHRVMSHMKRLEMDFIRLMRFVLGVYTNHVPMTAFRTYLLSLTYSDVSQAVPHIENLSIGVDCWELRVDLLAERSVESIAYQIALLRRHSDLPVYLTMRTRSQTGGLPDIKDDPQMIPYQQAVLSLGLKMGVEYVDVNITSPPETIASLVRNKGNSQIIISWHDMAGRVSWSGPEVRSIFDHACREGADIVMMIGYARDFQDNLSLRAFVQEMQSKHVPLIALNTGPEGKMSRILNHFLTPVAHPAMPRISGPGQVSYLETQQVLYLTGLLKPLKYHIFGADVKTTASPIMHTVAFRKLGLPHTYHISEASDIQSYEAILNDPTFGGASIARPFKVEIGSRLRRLSKHAQAIGAVNTITATPTGPVGDNTDWKGIRTCISRALTPENVINANTTALVIGAGGVARAAIHALNHLGVSKIALVNRTMKAAHALASDMSRLDPGLYIHVLESIEPKVIKSLGLQPRIIVYAIPIPEQDDRDATRTRPHQDLLQIPGGGVLLDMTFQGDLALSPMLKLSKGIMNDAWVFVPGIEVLLEQGYEQIRLWTGRRPPRTDMRSAVMREYTGNNLYQGTLRSI